MEDKKNDVISNPNHYKLDGLDIEVRDVIKSALGTVGFLGFYEGNIIKYILRANKKNGLEDYKKARQYLDWLIEELDEDMEIDGQLSFLDDEMKQELAPEESIELNDLSRKIMHSVVPLTKEEQEKHKELAEKMYGSEEEIKEEQRENRENFLKLQEKINKKVIK